MNNRLVGGIIIGIAVLIGFIIFSFNKALTSIVNTSCSHGPECPMWSSISFQTNISIGIMIFVILIGLFLIIFGKTKLKQRMLKKITKEEYKKVLGELLKEEKQILEKIIESQGTIFQSDLVEKTGMTKVKITRILDKLEGKGIIERKRRGMTNVVILKNE